MSRTYYRDAQGLITTDDQWDRDSYLDFAADVFGNVHSDGIETLRGWHDAKVEWFSAGHNFAAVGFPVA